MTELPRGIVTFLFTDIEGSTRVWERDAGMMWAALSRHNAILGDAITRNHGFHFKTIGDACQAAFADPEDALRATVDAQCCLAAEPWGESGPLRVRMALHSGPAEPVNGDYLAPCLNRLSRLLSTGYGGQVLLSDAVRAGVMEHLPEGVSLQDLGRHRLRDLLESERVTQVVIEGLPDTFPPLKSLERHPTNLPSQPNPLVGRERELATITALLARDTIRMVTLTGIGGTGKTRLALQAGVELLDTYFDGVFFVDLAAVGSPDLVIPTIASTLGVRESGGLSLADALVGHLTGKHLLLILDNFEHLLEAAPDVAGLLERCEGIRVLTTSRARLSIRAEQEISIAPLNVPAPGRPLAEIAGSDAVSLFVQRAAAVLPGFTLTQDNAEPVARICARLDGLPLAIELAASRIKTLPPRALLGRLDRRLDLLTSGAQDLPARQRTLRATIEWSQGLLPPAHRAFFDRLAVFSGGFDLDAAREVAGNGEEDALDVLTSLLDRSLIRRTEGHDDVPRFMMLETLREFGIEQLERSGTLDDARNAHAAWCLSLTETARERITGPEQATWLARLELEHDNLRGALTWAAKPALREQHLRLASAAGRFWLIRGHFTEGRRWLEAAIETPGPIDPPVHVRLMNEAGNLAFAQGHLAVARQRYEAGFETARASGDRRMEAALLNNLGNVAMRLSEMRSAATHYEMALGLSAELGDDFMRANVLGNLGTIAHYQGDVDGALARYTECLTLWRQLGNTQGEVPMLLNLQLLLASHREHADRARDFGERCIALARRLGDRWNEALALMGMGQIEDTHENLAEALSWFTRSLDMLRSLDAQEGIRAVLGYIGVVMLDMGDIEHGIALLLEKLDADLQADDPDGIDISLEEIAVAALRRDEPRLAAVALGAAERIRETLGSPVQSQCQRRHDRSVAELQAMLGTSLDAIWEEGRQRPLEDVVDEIRRVFRTLPASQTDDPRENLLADLDALFADS